jgi:hypothetical protein
LTRPCGIAGTAIRVAAHRLAWELAASLPSERIMKDLLARYPNAGSFVAGLLIGLSILIPVFAMMITEPDGWHALWVLGAPISLASGFGLQAFVIGRRRHSRTTFLGWASHITGMRLSLER